MFHVFVDSNTNEELVNSFVECFTDNCQCVIDKDSAEIFIEICESMDDNTYLYTNNELFDVFSQNHDSQQISLAIINTLPEYIDETILAKLSVLSCPSIVLLGGKNKTNYKAIVEFVCFCLFQYFHIDSLLEPISFRDIDDIHDTKKIIKQNFSIVTDSKGNKSYVKIKDRDIVDATTIERSAGSEMFHVRRRFTDFGSEKLTTHDLNLAVTECNKYTGYHVYNENGKAIYQSNKNKTVVNSNRSVVLPTNETAIIRSGNGIRLKSQSGEFITVNDGEFVNVSKRLGNETEILVTRNGKQYMAVVSSDVLANF
jgi:hypothetical protein